MKRIHGQTIVITRRRTAGTDECNDPIIEDLRPETVRDAIVADARQANLTDPTRPQGTSTAKTVYLPRTWAWKTLKGARITIDGRDYWVIGDPQPIHTNLTPTAWHPVAIDVETEEDTQ